jgi:hypothetical protein
MSGVRGTIIGRVASIAESAKDIRGGRGVKSVTNDAVRKSAHWTIVFAEAPTKSQELG